MNSLIWCFDDCGGGRYLTCPSKINHKSLIGLKWQFKSLADHQIWSKLLGCLAKLNENIDFKTRRSPWIISVSSRLLYAYIDIFHVLLHSLLPHSIWTIHQCVWIPHWFASMCVIQCHCQDCCWPICRSSCSSLWHLKLSVWKCGTI